MTSSAFLGLQNRRLTVTGLVDSGTTDGGGNPIYTTTTKGTVKGRIDHRPEPVEVNGPDVNPLISEYEGFSAVPIGFTVTERDIITDADGLEYDVLGVHPQYGRVAIHHYEYDLQRVAA